MRCDSISAFGDEDVNLDALGHLGRDKMTVIFPRVVAGEQDLEPCDLDEEHGGSQNMAGRIWCDSDGGYGVSRVVVNCFDLGERRQVVCFCVQLGSGI